MFPEARVWPAEDLRVGLRADFERAISEQDVLDFAALSGDANPLHVDAGYAAISNFQGRIVHGAFQVGLASALIGMHLPGRNVLLGSINARFPAPLYFPCNVAVGGEVTAWDRELRAGQVRVVIQDAASRTPTAEILMGFTLHEASQRQPAMGEVARSAADGPAILITGASGGIGAALVRALAGNHVVAAMVNRQPLADDLKKLPGVVEVQADLGAAGWERRLMDALQGRPLHGIVHAAWPGAPHGGLLQCPDDLIDQQLRFGTTHLIRLARLLFVQAGEQGGRLIALGSIVGSKPVLSLAAYSLAKSALENTVRLLAPEMARRKITVNAVCPGFVPVGINKQADSRQQKVEAARIPLGRLCTAADVAGAVTYLLSPAGAFVSGQILSLTGGQL